MTLKGFHIIFITFSVLLALCGGAWCLWVNTFTGTSDFILGAIMCFVAAVALAIYGVWFYKKMKRLRLFA